MVEGVMVKEVGKADPGVEDAGLEDFYAWHMLRNLNLLI